MNNQTEIAGWIEAVKRRGGAPFLLILLEAFEPLAPALAQGLLVAQPLSSTATVNRRTERRVANMVQP